MEDRARIGRTIVATLRGVQSFQAVEFFFHRHEWLQIKVASMGAREVTIEFKPKKRCSSFSAMKENLDTFSQS